MRGTRARRLRREALPPDIREEMKASIRPLAEARVEKIGKARAKRNQVVANADAERVQSVEAAWAEFEKQHAEIVRAAESRAAAQRVEAA